MSPDRDPDGVPAVRTPTVRAPGSSGPVYAGGLVALMILVAALAGCLQGGADPDPGEWPGAWADQWAKDPCDPPDADISGNAPALDAYRGEPADVARRFAKALGEDLPTFDGVRERDDGRKHVWRNDTTEIEYRAGADGRLELLFYETDEPWPGRDAEEGERTLRSFLEAFAGSDRGEIEISPPGRNGNVYTVWQTWQGERLRPATRAHVGSYSSTFLLHVMHDVGDADASLPPGEAQEAAEAYDRCVMDRRDRSVEEGYRLDRIEQRGWKVRHESLTRVIGLTYTDPEPGHCGNLTHYVYADAATGAVHGWTPPLPLCD